MKKFVVAMAVGLAVTSQAGPALAGKDLDVVKARGQLICGVAVGGIAGFMTVDSQGKWTGMNVDICRGISAALFGDSEKVKYVPLSGQQRFTALQAGRGRSAVEQLDLDPDARHRARPRFREHHLL